MPRLHEASAAGDIEKIKSFIAEGDDVNDVTHAIDYDGRIWTPGHVGRKMSPLHIAAYHGHTHTVEILVASGANLELEDAWRDVPGYTALQIAATNKNYATALTLLKLKSPNWQETEEAKAFATLMLDRDIKNELMHAVIYKKPQNIFAIYADGCFEKEAGEYALRLASEYGTLSIINALLDCGVSVNACDEGIPAGFDFNSMTRKTPLGIAAKHGHDKAVFLLLTRGAEVDKPTHTNPNKTTSTPLREALCHLDFKHSNPKVFEHLLSFGADMKKVDDTAWHFFAEKGSAAEMDMLLNFGFDPNMQYQGKPYLLSCIKAYRSPLAVSLIQGGADVGYIDDEGKNYLHNSRSLKITQTLLDKDVSPSLRDHHGKLPIHYVNKESAELLATIGQQDNTEVLSLHDHRVLSSPVLFRQLVLSGKVDVNLEDEEGLSVLRKLAHRASGGHFENLVWLLKNNTEVNINQTSSRGGWTALHEAFSQIQGFVSMDYSDEDVIKNNFAQAIDALISAGAKPIPDKYGRTPLMCLTFNGFSRSFNHAVIKHYHHSEAEYYGVDAAFYKTKFYEIRNCGFQSMGGLERLPIISLIEFSSPIPKVLAAFWETIEAEKLHISQEKTEEIAMTSPASTRLSLFAIRDAKIDFPIAHFLDKCGADESLISQVRGFSDLYVTCHILFSEETEPNLLKELTEKINQQDIRANYKQPYRDQFISQGPCIEIWKEKEELLAWTNQSCTSEYRNGL